MEYKFNELPDWGPGLDQYAKTFHKRLCLSFENYVANKETTIDAPKNLIPLSLLETTLAAGENMHKIGFQRGGKLFPVLISTLRKYTELHRGTLFDNYYGFLCIRHLIRMVCIATLTKAKSFDRFMKSLTQGMSSHEVTDLLSGNALEAMAEALYTSDLYNVAKLLGCISSSGKAFPGDGGLTFKDVEFLIDILWEGRFWMVKLRRAGLLPGLPALIFVLCEMTIFSKRSPYKTPWAHIQELLFRSYLGDTTYSERALLRQLCRYTDHQIAEYELPQEYIAINEDDALDVITAYIDLLSPPLELELAPIMLLDISIMLFRYIYSLMTNGQRKMILEEMAPAIVRSALARLGLEIDREWDGTMQAPRRGFTREYAADVFGHMGIIEEQIVSYKVRQAYAQMVLEVDLYGLAGRVLLLITRETIDDPPEWRLLLSSFSRLQQIIENLPFPAALLDDVAHDWRKMFVYMAYNILAIPSTTPVTCLQEAFEAWLSLKPLTVKPQVGRFECEYPRCAVRFAQLRVPEAKISCEDCRSVSYCSARCQQMHWVMDIPDSHSLDCRPG